MLYTTIITDLEKIKRKIKIYYILPNHENDEVVPDESDIFYYKNGFITWEGLKLNYSKKLMQNKAMEWMHKVAFEAVSEDVVLVDKENDAEYSYRKLLADRMKNLFIGHIDIKYMGEITN